ncbi:unnamed protein product [Dovyalis caffra]|uniref:Late embryogenesis abundant protein LEA-2 subgroup domain-containing protein n=1 Tax=Dovyalis caffra TaxID=77055 RepID=A0AAV1RC50_9ROSI|nr:unnamed protein product [Dovyalis caffra]
MSQPSDLPTTSSSTTTKNPETDTAKAKAYDCCIFLLFITVSFILIVSVPVITRGIITLQPEIPQFNISSSSLTIINVSSNTITANLNVTFSTENPNSKTLSYDKIVALVLDGTESLSSITLPPFQQPGKTRKTLQAVFPSLFFQINENSSSGGAVNLTMELHAKAKYGRWTWPVEKDSLKATCHENVKVEFPSNVTTLVFGSSECGVNGQWKRIVTKCSRIFRNYIYVVAIVLFILFVSL